MYFYYLNIIMENKPVARTLRLLSQLMELHEGNPFKIKSVANAAFKVDKLPFPIAGKTLEQLEKVNGIGKSIASKIIELFETGTIAEMQELLDNTPAGVVEKWGSRTIDIDILFYGDEFIEEPDLKVPHPELHKRRFTLEPLAEIAAAFVHPVLHKNILQLKNELTDNLIVKKV